LPTAAPGLAARPNSLANPALANEAPVLPAPAAQEDAAPDDVPGYFAPITAPAQVFWVRAGRDTVLLGQQGTLVAVPAAAWDVPAGSPAVRLELREFYATPDIILAGLSTRSGARLLETGGMIKLDASQNGQPVALRAGQRLRLRMPTQRKLDGMQLFQGVGADGQHGVDWQLPAAARQQAATREVQIEQKSAEFDLNKGGRWPQLPGGNKFLLKFFDQKIPGNAATVARLRRRRPENEEEKQLLKLYSKANHKKIVSLVRVRLTVDSAGVMQAQPLPYGDAEVGAAVLAATAKLPQWRAARFRRLAKPHRLEKANAVGVLSVVYTSAGKRLIGVQWDETATHLPRLDRYFAALEAQARQQGQQEFAAQFASAGPLTLNQNLYYELEADGLGWINCDRFLQEGPRVEFAVQTAQPNTVVTLVFREQRSILASTRQEPAAAVFAEVPAGAPATVVALRRENGITFLATAPVTVGQAAPPSLNFRPVSLEELRATLAKL
jgi:hypothetical protein